MSDPNHLKQEEAKVILSKLASTDYLVLLDENGASYSSVAFSNWMEKRLSNSGKKMVFLIGGAFGFSPDVYARADEKIALSKMTFSHQMVRLFFLEQLYRAMTILKNEPYHNS
jgi:23S rRNA (pseudouridine1915-N3)-methyltransferase